MRAHFMARVWSVRRGDATEQSGAPSCRSTVAEDCRARVCADRDRIPGGASDYRPLPAPATNAAGALVAKELQTPLGVEAASWKNGLAHFGDEGLKPAPAKRWAAASSAVLVPRGGAIPPEQTGRGQLRRRSSWLPDRDRAVNASRPSGSAARPGEAARRNISRPYLSLARAHHVEQPCAEDRRVWSGARSASSRLAR